MADESRKAVETDTAVDLVEEVTQTSDIAAGAQADGGSGSSEGKPRRKHKAAIAVLVVCAVLVGGSAGMYVWHSQPSFCSTLCHIEQTYVDNYSQEKGQAGTDKYGNVVTNTNAMMAVLHSHNDTTAKPEIVCVDCHEPNMQELASDGVHYVTGNYYNVRTERTLDEMKSWDGEDGTSFCVNEACHAYLMGEDGLVNRDKLEDATATLEFNPHSQYHEATSDMSCGTCHKGHRASVYACTACHDDIELPDGWVSASESEEIMQKAYA